MTTPIQAAIEALTRYDISGHDYSVDAEPCGDYLIRADVLVALQAAPAQGSIDTPIPRWQDEYEEMPDFSPMKHAQTEIDDLRAHIAQRAPIHFTLCRILQDHLIEENECNSVDFEAIYSRKTEQELADEINKRLAQRAASGDLPFGIFVERADGTTEFKRTGEAFSPTAQSYKFWTLYTAAPVAAEPAPKE